MVLARNWHQVIVISALSFFGLLPAPQAIAQLKVETPVLGGYLAVGVAPLKSSYVGAYDFYLGPAVKNAIRDWRQKGGELGGSSSGTDTAAIQKRRGRPSAWRILFPSGKIPDDLRASYGARPGYSITLDWRGSLPFWPIDGGSVISVAFMHDSNQVRIKAPSGLGILIDPTMVTAKASYKGLAVSAEAPVLHLAGARASHTLRLGGGFIAYRTTTYFNADSAFLRLAELDVQTLVRPMITASYSFRLTEPSNASGLRFSGVDVSVHGIQTTYFWSVGASATTVFRF